MKVFIHYQTKSRADAFEGYRLRKTLKGACEAMDVAWVDSLVSQPDIAHFISSRDAALALKLKEGGTKIVCSAFYCENDAYASFLDHKNGEIRLSEKGLKMLSIADLVLVPNQAMKDFALASGVKKRIEIHAPGVNLARFDPKLPEKKIFPRYFRVRPSERYFVAIGNYEDKDTLNAIRQIAPLCPQFRFYFFGTDAFGRVANIKRRFIQRHCPENLVLQPIVDDDVYRSALMNASGYLLLDDDHPDAVGLLDAFAAKAPIFVLGDQKYNDALIPGENCYQGKDVVSLVKAIADYYRIENKTTIIAGLNYVKSRSLEKFGQELIAYYQSLIQQD